MSSDRAGPGRRVSAAYERVSTWIRRRVRSKRDETAEERTAPASDGADGSGAPGTPGGVPDGGTETTGDDGHLSAEERILLILRRSGRTRQSELVERLDWSKATVSRRLSRMEEAGRVRRLTVGREKIVALPEEEFGSVAPFDGPTDDGHRDGGDDR